MCIANIQTPTGKGLLASELPFPMTEVSSPSSLLCLSSSQPQAWPCFDFSGRCCGLPPFQHLPTPPQRLAVQFHAGPLSSLMITGKACALSSSEKDEKLYHLHVRSTHWSFCLNNLESEWKIRRGKPKKEMVGQKETFLSISIIINKF